MTDSISWHRMTDVDREARTATCSICGPVAVKLKGAANIAQCMTKVREDKRKWAIGRKRPPRTAPRKPRSHLDHRRDKYRLTAEQFDSLMTAQGGRCAVCRAPIDEATCHVDHDHACCGQGVRPTCGTCTRGLLCRRCNLGLGWFGDSGDVLRAAVEYLER